jgi:hypothetical protein
MGCRIKYVHLKQINSLGTGKLEAILHTSLQNHLLSVMFLVVR